MLVISRKKNEKLYIVTPDGTRLDILVTELTRQTARLSINAPDDFQIRRGELEDKEE